MAGLYQDYNASGLHCNIVHIPEAAEIDVSYLVQSHDWAILFYNFLSNVPQLHSARVPDRMYEPVQSQTILLFLLQVEKKWNPCQISYNEVYYLLKMHFPIVESPIRQ